jgi:SAM-dependent methyltransferase
LKRVKPRGLNDNRHSGLDAVEAIEGTQSPGVSDIYARGWSSHVESPTRQRIRKEVYGDDFPEEADPRGFVTLSELERMAQALDIGPGQTFVDLACGHGGPSLWLAKRTGASVIGIDASEVAIANGPERARAFGLLDQASFRVADVTATGLADESCDGATCIDSLFAFRNKVAAVRECGRVLKRGARFAFTNWDRDIVPPNVREQGLEPLDDHRTLLVDNGFDVDLYDVLVGAEDRRKAFYQGVVNVERELEEEMGAESAQKLLAEARGNLGLVDGVDYMSHSKRIFVVARKR